MTTGLLTTTAGRAAIIADLGGGADLVLTHVAWGDANGVPYNPNEAQVALVNEKYRATIASVAVVGGAIVVDAVIPADTNDGTGRPSHSFNVAEVGLFGSTGTLIGVARCGNGYKPPPSSGQAHDVTYRLKLAVANPSAITVVVDPQAQVAIGRLVRPGWITVDGVLNNPPGAPALGATYIVGAAPTGAWTGFANRIAQWIGVWSLASVPLGHQVTDNTKGRFSSGYRLERTAAGWEAVRPAAPITLAAGGQPAILATNHDAYFERDVLANGGFPLPSLASTPLGTEFTVRLTGAVNTVPVPAITVAGGGNIIWRGKSNASMPTFGRGEVLSFRRVADGYLMSVVANSDRVFLVASNLDATWYSGPTPWGPIMYMSDVSGDGAGTFAFDGRKLTIPVEGQYFIQETAQFNANGGPGGGGIAITPGPYVSKGLSMAYTYLDIVANHSPSLFGNGTNVMAAGQNVEFNIVMLNSQTRIRPQDMGVTIIYLGR